jgi:ABC-type multidrug transport system ATPase subunit
MIKLESAHIEEVRGIRKLDIDFRKETFAISGPNGSGKSGVIDAIEFGLTGQIGRLAGRGTQGLSVSEHGPHVDKTKFPDASFVELRVFLPATGKSATITRKVSSPKKPKIVPADDDVMAALAEVAEHPEITLSRREILRFILVAPSMRSEEIQTLLKLDEIGQTRSALNTAQNKLQTAQRTAAAWAKTSQDALQLHLQLATLSAEDVLETVNKRRKLLGLPEMVGVTGDARLDDGLVASGETSEFNKQSALRDLNAFTDAANGFPVLAKTEALAITGDLAKLEADPALLVALQRLSFIEKGVELVESADCPLCDKAWDDEQQLLDHLRAKVARLQGAQKLQNALLKNSATIAAEVAKVVRLIATIQKIADAVRDEEVSRIFSAWKSDLEELRPKLGTVDGLAGLKGRLAAGWVGTPKEFANAFKALSGKIAARPDQTATVDAQTFLTTAQIRLGDYREANRKSDAAAIAATSAKTAYETYCGVMDDELEMLYTDVQEDFSAYYRAINEDDESTFTAKFSSSEGKLDLAVNFYERGLFPPGAYHSEGHQDGMGVCLYLALMKRLFGGRFTVALLDDVVMSVDSGHRYQFCKLLKTQFPNTQFIITTHDRLWAEQMKSAGLVTAKTSIVFNGWTIETGPLVESNEEIWDEIDRALAKGKVEVAAAALRHHLEYVSRLLADQLSAAVPFRADGNFELGDLLPNVLSRMRSLYAKAAEAAQSWGKNAEKDAAVKRKETLSTSAGAYNVEQWAVNKAVHYNEWANFGRTDFTPVVAAFKELLECFRCETCGSWLYATPRHNPESLRCPCNETSLNLKPKGK